MEKSRRYEIMKRFYYCVKQYETWIQEKTNVGMNFKHEYFLIESGIMTGPVDDAYCSREVYRLYYINPETSTKEYLDTEQKDSTMYKWIRKIKRLQKKLDAKQVEKETGILL